MNSNKQIKKILVATFSFLTLILWPVNLYLKNTLPNFVSYIIPAIFLLISYFAYSKNSRYWLTPVLLIGVYEPKLVILPVVFCFIEMIINYKKETLSFLIIALAIFVWQFGRWEGQIVFNKDYEGEQLLIRNIHLYPNVFTARLFQNKPKLYLGKVTTNFFTLTDLNNYFFAGHPAPTTIPSQELYKYYWPLIIFLIIGIYYFYDINNKNFILISIASCLLSLSLLKNFDRNDFILWFPIGLIIIHGIKKTLK